MEDKQVAAELAWGVDSGFWAWLQGQMAEEMRDLVQQLSIPEGMRIVAKGATKAAPDDFIRGKIRAINWLMALPNGWLAQYAATMELERRDNPEAPPGAPRRASATPREDENGRAEIGGSDQL